MVTAPSRPAAHVTGDVGQTATALVLKQWGWTADVVVSDYGEDLDCVIFVDHRRTSLHFRCQVKSTADEEGIRRLKSGSFGVSIPTPLCKLWLLSYFPVLLVVSDVTSGNLFWGNATEQVKKAIDKLSQKTLTLHVNRENLLAKSKSAVTETIEHFYSQLLRLSSRSLTCKVYPVVMPGYRAIPFTKIIQTKVSKQLLREVEIEPITQDKDWLPAWTTAIKTLEQHFIAGWEVTTSRGDIQDFSSSLRRALIALPLPTEKSEWISFVCSPVEFKAMDETSRTNSIWNKKLTLWWNYSRLEKRLETDDDYAFSLPRGFLRQIARRATSWETFHHVDPMRDISIQLFANVATTPGDRWDLSAMRQNVHGQFVPWTCSSKEVGPLLKLLQPLELVFRKVPGVPAMPGIETGIICTFFFEPGVGLFTPAHTWNEFIEGTVRWRLESSGALGKLPGQEGPPEVGGLILDTFGDLKDGPPDSVLTSEKDYSSGLPLDQRHRRVFVQGSEK